MTPRLTADPSIGDRIQARRLLRGWSIRHAASRAGISHATWSRIERGRQAADNRFMLADIATALECSPAELAGSVVPAADRAVVAAHAAVHGIRQALVDIDLTETPSVAAPPLASLAGQLTLTDELRQACDYAGAARLTPDLLRGLHAAAAGPGRREALPMLINATHIASSVLRNLGHLADAWLAAERCRDAAEAAGDPVLLGVAAYARAGAASACGSFDRALTIASRAIDDLSDRPGGAEVAGTLRLLCSYASRGRRNTDDSRAWAAEAAALAEHTGETTTLALYFGPTNVGIWRIGIEVDGDDPGRAAEVARDTNPGVLAYGFRQVFYYADTARALARLRKDQEAIRFLLTAERIAPQHVHTSAVAQETTRALLERSRRLAGGSELRGLCERMRVA
ncbi:helix-turn-helix transcriptional regulator [Paractinoplanes ferrugineus]|uniref:Transcriptional regulator n=1 Tax=Paractinoplanes ferrugineus TaxID=113564 RepID=A0A919J3F9_9ACTN|nr:helix-turn-helix transcriptional regulator [Actinoplanes ferrugineus]GIE12687.1 transcriptional regulator [Actinoplanes ferrugineus]